LLLTIEPVAGLMRKYPFIFCFLFVTVTLPAVVLGQTRSDTLVLRIANLPCHFEAWNGEYPNIQHTVKEIQKTAIHKFYFTSDTTYNDTIVLSDVGGKLFLTIVFKDSTHLDEFNLSWSYPKYVGFAVTLKDVQITRSNNAFSFVVSGSDLPGKLIKYGDSTFVSYYLAGVLYMDDEFETWNGLLTDSSSISVQFIAPKSEVHYNIEADNDKLNVYPVPASNALTVRSKDLNKQITLYDQLGRECTAPIVNKTTDEVTYNTSNLRPGAYWLRYGDLLKKFIIQR
jgi:hypothetical protein